MSKHFFITSSGTNVGKTYVTSMLTKQLLAQGRKIVALKPIISGYDAADQNSDTTILMAAQETTDIEAISLFRFAAPLAPNMAAAKENKTVSLSAIMDFCLQKRDADIVLVEGVGGIMVPLNDEKTTLDWMVALDWPVIVVVGSYLGAISHALSACEVLRARGLTIQAVIVSESENSTVDFVETCLTMDRFLRYAVRIIRLPRGAVGVDLTGVVA